MKFATRYSEKETVFTEPGERYRIEYQLSINENGEEYLEPIGQTDMFAEIQSHRDSCDLDLILMRLKNGEADALDKVKGFYADVSEMPVRMSEILNMNLRGQQVFDSLSSEYKEVFGNDYRNFVLEPERLIKYVESKNAENKTIEKEVIVDDNKE